ncbi:MAG: hypothetical protein K0Q51_1451 [Rickettsiaceae bacterium]|jgi:tetratricopeptide (TPR) repeat protein|nr:hypothetical protein [Rickettsiaceae bacterium]
MKGKLESVKGMGSYDNSEDSNNILTTLENISLNDPSVIIHKDYQLLAEQYLSMGKYYYDHCKAKEALECFDRSIDLNSYYAAAYTEKGNDLRFLGDNQEALNLLEKAIKLDNDYIITYYLKVRVLLTFNGQSQTVDCYNKAEQLFDDSKVNAEVCSHLSLSFLFSY